MPHLILIRHSTSQQLPGVSPHDWTLTDEGRNRCMALAEQIRHYRIGCIASSDEPKAYTTAELLAEHIGVDAPIIVEPAFRETRRDSAPFFSDQEAFKAAIRAAMFSPNRVVFGEEAFTEARLRFTRALYQLVSSKPDQTLAVVTHGTVLSLVLGHATGDDPYMLWSRMGMPAYAVLTPNLDLLDLHYTV